LSSEPVSEGVTSSVSQSNGFAIMLLAPSDWLAGAEPLLDFVALLRPLLL